MRLNIGLISGLGLLLFAAGALGGDQKAPQPRSLTEVKAVLAKTPTAWETNPPRPLLVVLVADVKDHGPGQHDYPAFQRAWSELLGGVQIGTASGGPIRLYDQEHSSSTPEPWPGAPGVKTATAWHWPSAAQWAAADLIVANCYLDWTESRLRQLDTFLGRGGGFVLVHAATWTKPAPSEQLAALTGVGGFTAWREGPVELRLVREHPICLGLPERICFEDESYWPPTPGPAPGAIQVVATSMEQGAASETAFAQPLIWARNHKRGRVFGCVPGHYNWTFDDPYYRILLLRGMAWAAGESPYRFDGLVLREARAKHE